MQETKQTKTEICQKRLGLFCDSKTVMGKICEIVQAKEIKAFKKRRKHEVTWEIIKPTRPQTGKCRINTKA